MLEESTPMLYPLSDAIQEKGFMIPDHKRKGTLIEKAKGKSIPSIRPWVATAFTYEAKSPSTDSFQAALSSLQRRTLPRMPSALSVELSMFHGIAPGDSLASSASLP